MVYPHDCCNMRVKMLGTRAKPKPELLLATKICNSCCRQHLSLASAALCVCVWCYRLVSGPGSPHKYDDPLHC